MGQDLPSGACQPLSVISPGSPQHDWRHSLPPPPTTLPALSPRYPASPTPGRGNQAESCKACHQPSSWNIYMYTGRAQTLTKKAKTLVIVCALEEIHIRKSHSFPPPLYSEIWFHSCTREIHKASPPPPPWMPDSGFSASTLRGGWAQCIYLFSKIA